MAAVTSSGDCEESHKVPGILAGPPPWKGTPPSEGTQQPHPFLASHVLTSEGLSCPLLWIPSLFPWHLVGNSLPPAFTVSAPFSHRSPSQAGLGSPPAPLPCVTWLSTFHGAALPAFVFGWGHQCHGLFHRKLTKTVTDCCGFHHQAAFYKELSRNLSSFWDEET